MTVAMEETEPVPSEDGWILTVHVNKVDSSPGGTRNVLQSESYNYRRGADSESAEEKKKKGSRSSGSQGDVPWTSSTR